ncbi:MAG TPA: DUF3617 domain-containing protein [Steroidobacteraceae bacterium]|nr:DUF3617 domain-containing protein [Steroidobacteraceae bacterium]
MSSKLGVATALCLLAVIAVAADRIAIKPGLWEISHTMESEGVPVIPEDVLARLSPEQRARMEAAMKAHGGGALGTNGTVRECITEKDLDHPFKADKPESHCTHTTASRTATSMEVHMQCKDMGRPGMNAEGTFKWQAPTSESMQGLVEMHMSDGTHTMTHRTKLTGKWLGADCGDVKPHGSQAD